MKQYSERVSNKNLRIMNGKPLFYWIYKSLLHVKQIEKIYLDTDSQLIKRTVESYFGHHIIVLDRPDEVRGDMVTANTLIESLLSRIDGDLFLMTHVTNPLLKPETISKAISEYYNRISLYDSLIGVNIHNSNFYNLFGQPINHDPRIVEMSQQVKPVYEENSCLYIFSRNIFDRYGRVGQVPIKFPVNKLESVDINTMEDWVIAEAVMCFEDRAGA